MAHRKLNTWAAAPAAFAAALLALLLSAACRSQTVDISALDPQTVPQEYSGGGDEWKSWSEARNAWYRESFASCLKQAGIRMSCGGCASAYFKVIIQIDDSGRIASMRKFQENVCGKPAPVEYEKCVQDFYRARTFPALRGRVFRASLGTGLSC